MAENKYFDLKIDDDDLLTDDNNQAVLVFDRDSIAQDIVHMIRESGYLVAMVGQRDADQRRLLLQQIMILVEEDKRIVPGTVAISSDGTLQRWTLRADTYEFGPLSQVLEATKE